MSVNNCICHFSPLVSEADVILAEGDMVKIDMGAHIDGFIAVVAHTLVVGSSASNPVTGKKADALLAAHLCSEAALRLVKPGNETYEVTETVSKIAESFDCKVQLSRGRPQAELGIYSQWRGCCLISWSRTGLTARRPSFRTPLRPRGRSTRSTTLLYTRCSLSTC